jgi:glutathione S-transferase
MPEDRVEYIRKAYGLLEAVLNNHDYLAGKSMTLADIASVATVSSSAVKIEAEKYDLLCQKGLYKLNDHIFPQVPKAVGLDGSYGKVTILPGK